MRRFLRPFLRPPIFLAFAAFFACWIGHNADAADAPAPTATAAKDPLAPPQPPDGTSISGRPATCSDDSRPTSRS